MTQQNHMKFRIIMYALFLAPCAFALAGSGSESNVAIILSLLLTGILGLCYLGVDFIDAIHANTTKFVWPKTRAISSFLVMAVCTVLFWAMVIKVLFY